MVRYLSPAVLIVLCLARAASAQMEIDELPKVPLPGPIHRPFPSKEELQRFLEPVKPKPIPDNPPPHEGALISQPYIVEPPDLLVVEVLEALPGRPIAGERLVRPDGTIHLGFYGSVYVRGLTLEQVKTAIILHLREFLTDEVLGFYSVDEDPSAASPAVQAADKKETTAPPPSNATDTPKGVEASPPPKEVRTRPTVRRSTRLRRKQIRVSQVAPPEAPAVDVLPVNPFADEGDTNQEKIAPVKVRMVHPADSGRVYVDVASYNSKVYFALGDVGAPGRMPITGRETVIDAIQHAGGLLMTADPKNVTLIRPGQDGKPAKVYPIDYDAIVLRGERQQNYQLFPGDRIFVGRNALIKATIEIDRLADSQYSVIKNMVLTTVLWRSMASPTLGLGSEVSLFPSNIRSALGAGHGAADYSAPLTQEQQDALIKNWVDFWSKLGANPDGFQYDEKAYREALLRVLKRPAPEKK